VDEGEEESVLEESVGVLESEVLESAGVVSAGALLVSVAVGWSTPLVMVVYSTMVVVFAGSSVHEPVSDALV
jgi:hypothetical protein